MLGVEKMVVPGFELEAVTTTGNILLVMIMSHGLSRNIFIFAFLTSSSYFFPLLLSFLCYPPRAFHHTY